MSKREKVVLRLSDGEILKGYLIDFSPDLSALDIEEASNGRSRTVRIEELKAVFFVRSFEGNQAHKEKKTYGPTGTRGNRVYIRFKDGESLVGFLEGDVPWEKGFFLSKQGAGQKGFFILPVDEETNNLKVYVMASSVDYVTVVP
jgi:small nuclear ribonucleoprotein (snRNP)-like protein